MYNLTPPYLTPNMFFKSKKVYKNNFYNPQNYKTQNNTKEHLHYNIEKKQEPIETPPEQTSKNSQYNDDVLFEILGLKIYFDDVLIICILLFLYQEGIQDEYLFIALILLLLS